MVTAIRQLSDRLVEALAPKATVQASYYCEDFCYCDSQGRTRARACQCGYSEYWGFEQICNLNCDVVHPYC